MDFKQLVDQFMSEKLKLEIETTSMLDQLARQEFCKAYKEYMENTLRWWDSNDGEIGVKLVSLISIINNDLANSLNKRSDIYRDEKNDNYISNKSNINGIISAISDIKIIYKSLTHDIITRKN